MTGCIRLGKATEGCIKLAPEPTLSPTLSFTSSKMAGIRHSERQSEGLSGGKIELDAALAGQGGTPEKELDKGSGKGCDEGSDKGARCG
jgi:hypothetical protein